jgi:hypothetical protein
MSTPHPFDIAAASQELKNIDAELKRLRTFAGELKKRKTLIEEKIQKYLTEHNHKGVMINDVTIISEMTEKKTKLPKVEQDEKMKQILSQYVNLPEKVLYELKQITQGPITSKPKITLHTDKKDKK